MEEMLGQHQPSPEAPWDLVVTDIAGDATKSSAWREQKLQCLYYRTSYTVAGNPTVTKTCWPDVLVADDGSARGCHRLLINQLRALQPPMLDPEVSAQLHPRQLRISHIVGDCGPDQVGFRQIVAKQYLIYPFLWLTALPCFMHQGQLACLRHLAMADRVLEYWNLDIAYFSTLVKVCHLLRQNYDLVSRAARRRFSPEKSKHWQRKVPVCVGGRWLSVTTSEQFLLSLEWYEFRLLLSDCFFDNFSLPLFHDHSADGPEGDGPLGFAPPLADAPAEPAAPAPSAPARGVRDDVSFDEMAAFHEKDTRYRRDVRKATSLREFWTMLKLSNRTKRGIDYLLCFLQSKLSNPEVAALAVLNA